jgi:transposase InsO family protein
VKFAFIDAEKANWPVLVLCAVLSVSRAGFYAWLRRAPSATARANVELEREIAEVHARSRCTYGSPRVFHALKSRGLKVGRKRVERLMRKNGIFARRKRKFRKTTDSAHADPIAPNTLDRKFHAEQPNKAWVTDVTYVWTLEGWVYLAAILDLCSRRVVGWAAGESNDRGLALTALSRAWNARHPGPGLLHHSDRGSTYASTDYRAALQTRRAEVSMSRKGDCWDNAVAESFFATIKGELVDHERYVTREQAIASIADYIDNFYNPHRIHSSIGYVSPIEYELRLQSKRMAA